LDAPHPPHKIAQSSHLVFTHACPWLRIHCLCDRPLTKLNARAHHLCARHHTHSLAQSCTHSRAHRWAYVNSRAIKLTRALNLAQSSTQVPLIMHHTHTNTHTHTHTHAHTHTYTYTHTHTTHTHTHTHIQGSQAEVNQRPAAATAAATCFYC